MLSIYRTPGRSLMWYDVHFILCTLMQKCFVVVLMHQMNESIHILYRMYRYSDVINISVFQTMSINISSHSVELNHSDDYTYKSTSFSMLLSLSRYIHVKEMHVFHFEWCFKIINKWSILKQLSIEHLIKWFYLIYIIRISEASMLHCTIGSMVIHSTLTM